VPLRVWRSPVRPCRVTPWKLSTVLCLAA